MIDTYPLTTFAIKPSLKALDWVDLTVGLSKQAKLGKRGLKRTKTVIKWLHLPENVQKWSENIKDLSQKSSYEKSAKVFSGSMALISTGTGLIKILNEEKIVELSKSQLNVLSAIGAVSCFSYALKGGFDIAKCIQKFDGSLFQTNELVLKIGKLALSIIGLFGFFTGITVVVKWSMLILSTTTLVLGISKYLFTIIDNYYYGIIKH